MHRGHDVTTYHFINTALQLKPTSQFLSSAFISPCCNISGGRGEFSTGMILSRRKSPSEFTTGTPLYVSPDSKFVSQMSEKM